MQQELFAPRTVNSKALTQAANQIIRNVLDFDNHTYITYYNDSWRTFSVLPGMKRARLDSTALRKTYRGEQQYGISLVNSKETRFMVIDFDYHTDKMELEFDQAEELIKVSIRYLKEILAARFGIEHTLVNHSGGKGYHLWILFKRAISFDKVNEIYTTAIDELRDYVMVFDKHIDCIPTKVKGVKLPASVHPKKGTRAWIVDDSFEPMFQSDNEEQMILSHVEHFAYFSKNSTPKLRNTSVELEVLIDVENALEPTQKASAEASIERLNLESFGGAENIRAKCEAMIQNMVFADTQRNFNTYFLACYCNEQGMDQDNAINLVSTIAENSEHLYKSSVTHAVEEAERIVTAAYEKGYVLGETPHISLRSDDIITILKADARQEIKDIMFLFLLIGTKHTKNHHINGQVIEGFNAPWSVLEKLTTANRNTVMKARETMIALGLLNVAVENQINEELTKKKGSAHNDANLYQLEFANTGSEVIVDLNAIRELRGAKKHERAIFRTAAQTVSKKELKAIVGAKTFENNSLNKLYA